MALTSAWLRFSSVDDALSLDMAFGDIMLCSFVRHTASDFCTYRFCVEVPLLSLDSLIEFSVYTDRGPKGWGKHVQDLEIDNSQVP